MAESLLSQNPRLIFFDDNSKIDLLVKQVSDQQQCWSVFFTIADMG